MLLLELGEAGEGEPSGAPPLVMDAKDECGFGPAEVASVFLLEEAGIEVPACQREVEDVEGTQDGPFVRQELQQLGREVCQPNQHCR